MSQEVCQRAHHREGWQPQTSSPSTTVSCWFIVLTNFPSSQNSSDHNSPWSVCCDKIVKIKQTVRINLSCSDFWNFCVFMGSLLYVLLLFLKSVTWRLSMTFFCVSGRWLTSMPNSATLFTLFLMCLTDNLLLFNAHLIQFTHTLTTLCAHIFRMFSYSTCHCLSCGA